MFIFVRFELVKDPDVSSDVRLYVNIADRVRFILTQFQVYAAAKRGPIGDDVSHAQRDATKRLENFEKLAYA